MLSALESTAVVLASIAAALTFLLVLRHFWPTGNRHKHNDTIGWQLGFIGTTYAVIIAFTLSDVWTSYQAAEANAQVEANAIVNLYRVSDGFPSDQAMALRSLTHAYSDDMVQREWPAMMKSSFSPNSFGIMSRLWKTVMSSDPKTALQQACVTHALTDLTNIAEHRRIRQLQSQSTLPAVFWLVLVAGQVMTVAYTCLFDIEDLRMHVLQVVGVTFLISLVLVTIADVDSPYGGALHIQPTGFVLANQTMNRSGE